MIVAMYCRYGSVHVMEHGAGVYDRDGTSRQSENPALKQLESQVFTALPNQPKSDHKRTCQIYVQPYSIQCQCVN